MSYFSCDIVCCYYLWLHMNRSCRMISEQKIGEHMTCWWHCLISFASDLLIFVQYYYKCLMKLKKKHSFDTPMWPYFIVNIMFSDKWGNFGYLFGFRQSFQQTSNFLWWRNWNYIPQAKCVALLTKNCSLIPYLVQYLPVQISLYRKKF